MGSQCTGLDTFCCSFFWIQFQNGLSSVNNFKYIAVWKRLFLKIERIFNRFLLVIKIFDSHFKSSLWVFLPLPCLSQRERESSVWREEKERKREREREKAIFEIVSLYCDQIFWCHSFPTLRHPTEQVVCLFSLKIILNAKMISRQSKDQILNVFLSYECRSK